jgi:hypothetical protein|tara:strand:- start:4302 stop:5384 length:1083 start_codon:yes stop_codon:yes gene_type:complete
MNEGIVSAIKNLPKNKNKGIAELVKRQEGSPEEGEGMQLIGKEGVLFDTDNPLSYLALIPGVGLGGMLALKGLSRVSPSIIKASKEILKRTGKVSKRAGFQVRDPKTGRILSDEQAGKFALLGRTRSGQITRGAGAAGALTGQAASLSNLAGQGDQQVVEKTDEGAPEEGEVDQTFDEVKNETNQRLAILNDPAFQRALIAGGAAMMQPTEGLGRSFLGLGEFGEAFAESLGESDARKTDIERLHDVRVKQAVAQNQEIPSFQSTIELAQGDSSGMDVSEYIQAQTLLASKLQGLNPNIDKINLNDFVIPQEGGSPIPVTTALANSSGDPADIEFIANNAQLQAVPEKESKGIFGFFSGD